MTTRVLAYSLTDDGRAGELLAAASLLLPYFATFHPSPTPDHPQPNLDALQRAVGDRVSGEVRVRVVIIGAVTEVSDGTVFFGSGEHDEGEPEDDGWVASVLLDVASRQPCVDLPWPPGMSESDPRRVLALFDRYPVAIDARDLVRRRPGRPRSSSAAGVKPAAAVQRAWPPAGDATKWKIDRPGWLPPCVPFPLPDFDCSVLRPHCPFLCRFLCDC